MCIETLRRQFLHALQPSGVAALALLACIAGCSIQPRARTVTGPDGSPMLHVACGRDQGACFELAGQGCPFGYKVFPVFDPRDNNFLVRCHAALAQRLDPIAPVPAFAPVAQPQPSPWSSAAASVPLAPPPQTLGTLNDSEIDLGY